MSAALARLVLALALQPSVAQEQFVPATAASTEHLPAAPLVIAAYAFVWLATAFYVWTVWRRFTTVESELKDLERRMPGARSAQSSQSSR